jgi:peptide alpha-N-acetyltransferase
MSKFTRNETVGGALGDLHEMQCVWYLTEDGEAYLRQRKLGLALKRFHTVYNIFDVWQEDQFDFHSFSLRKGMIRAYIDMVRWEDHLRDHPFYTRMALSAIKAYTLLHDQPDLAHGPLFGGLNCADGADSAERRKALKKAKREQQKLEKAEAEKREAKKASSTGKSADGETKKEDPDPLGNKLVQTQDPLKESLKFLSPLLEYTPQNIRAQTAGFEVYLRRSKFLFYRECLCQTNFLFNPDKYLLALKCILAAHSINSSDPILHVQLLRFRLTLNSLPEPLPEKISSIVSNEFEKLLPKAENLGEWNESYMTSHQNRVEHVQAALVARLLINPDTKPQCEKELLSTLDLDDATLDKAIAGLDLFDEWKSSSAVRQAYIEKAHKKWSEASTFESK